MSSMELWTGTMTKIENPVGKTMKEKVEYLKSKNFVFYDYCEDYFDSWDIYKTKIYYNDKTDTWWKLDMEEHDEDEYAVTHKRFGDEISFTAYFYNGGTCLPECLDEIVEELETKEK